MKYLILLSVIIAGCCRTAAINTPFVYNEVVLVKHEFYGEHCCQIKGKGDATGVYLLYCRFGPTQLDTWWQNGNDITITKGCEK